MIASGGASGGAPPLRLSTGGVEWNFRSGILGDIDGSGLDFEVHGEAEWMPDPVVGGAVRFAGGHLRIPAHRVGPLDVGRQGDAVTVVALVRRDDLATGFVAGMWQEDDDDPRRQYGLFLSLPTYGGAQQVNGHVSADGRPSPGLPYSRDYAATARAVRPGSWRVVGFTYDGLDITAYLDGVADRRPTFTEVGPPLGQGLRYAKNPYRYALGLNRGAVSDFTVGAVRLTSTMGNVLRGAVARLLVEPRALHPDEMFAVAASWAPVAGPVIDLDGWQGPARP